MRKPKFIGVFSDRSNIAAKGKARPQKRFFFCWDLGDQRFAVQELDGSFSPVELPKGLNERQLKAAFRYEPGILAAPVSTPDFRTARELTKKPPVPPPGRKTAELNDEALAALEQARRARQVENDLRNSFDKAVRALGRPRDRKGAIAALGQIVETTEGLVPEHKHMFRDFGVTLRKKSLPELAARFAARAVQLAPNDDHAHFNLARLLGSLGRYTEAEQHIVRAMKLDRREPVYPKLLAWISSERNS